MAVNEDLYSWMLKTYGMPAAEWYRSNPNNKPGGNPYLPKGAYVPKADIGSDDTYASVSPEFEEVSVTDNSSYGPLQALYDMPEDDYEQYRQSLGGSTYKFDSEEALKQMYPGATYTQKELPRYEDILLTEYGMGFEGGIGSGSHYLFNKYLNDPEGKRLRDDYTDRIFPAYQNMSPHGDVDIAIRLKNLEEEARANTQAQRALAEQYNQLYRGQVVEGWDENAFYAENISLPTRQNLAALIQQSEEGVQSSQDFLDDYVAKGGEGAQDIASILPPAMSQAELYREIQRRGGSVPGTKEYGELRDLQKEWIQRQKGLVENQTGPRGEVMTAQNKPTEPLRGQKTDVYYDKQMKQFVPRVDPGRVLNDLLKQAGSTPESVDVRVARASQQSDEQREKLTQQSEFDMSKEKQLASARAADTYRRSAANEDPFRAAARMG